jgi:ribosomal protein L37AE/L43A
MAKNHRTRLRAKRRQLAEKRELRLCGGCSTDVAREWRRNRNGVWLCDQCVKHEEWQVW